MRIWIDTDGGVDDALALACAIASRNVKLRGISTVFGNVSPRKAARNAALIQSFYRPPHVSVSVGAVGPIQGSWHHARAIHGEDGLGGATANHVLEFEADIVAEISPEATAERIANYAEEVGEGGQIVCIGPLTNLALALHRHPLSFARLGGIVTMGGALQVPPPRRGGYEFNFGSDLEAARGILAAAPRLTILPLDTCRQVVLRRARLDRIAHLAADTRTHFLQRAHRHYMESYKASEGIDGCYPHDTLAVATVAIPGAFTFEPIGVELDESGEFPGLLRRSASGRPVRIATGVDQRQALDWIESCLLI
jgi:inosine-uridine nucleoside N-ribohydrolase